MTITAFRSIISIKDLKEAVADGFATVVGAIEIDGHPRLVDVQYTDKNFPDALDAIHLMTTSKVTARKLGAIK